MLPVKRVDHISMAAPAWQPQAEKLEKLLGFKFLYSFRANSASDFEGSISQVPGTGIEFEIICPTRPDSFVQKYLDERGSGGLHHITVEVEDIREAAAEMERLGMKPFGGIQDDGMWHLTYIHPKDSGGILWQLFVAHKRPPEVDRTTAGGALNLQRLDHVSMAVSDLEKQIEWQQSVFGSEVEGRWEEEHLGYYGAIMTIPGSLLKFEIIQPSRPDSFVQKFIDKSRAGMHHICCEVASVDAAAEALRANGIEPYGGVIQNGWKKHTFLHPKDSGGVLFQLVEG